VDGNGTAPRVPRFAGDAASERCPKPGPLLTHNDHDAEDVEHESVRDTLHRKLPGRRRARMAAADCAQHDLRPRVMDSAVQALDVLVQRLIPEHEHGKAGVRIALVVARQS
jgi:hypothetical protein